MAVAQLAVARDTAGVDVSMRKIYVGNVPFEITSERLLGHFSSYGDIEEGPLGFDKQSGKQKGFAFFVYKTEEGARASLVDPIKNVDGHQVVCKLATDGKKGKPGGGVQGPTGMAGDAVPPPGSMNSNYGMPGGLTSYSGFSSGPPALPHQNPHMNSPLPSSIGGGQGFGNQAPPSFTGGTGGGYGGGVGGYGTGGYGGGSQYGGGSGIGGEYGGLNNPGSSMYRMPPTSGGYPESGNYGLSSAYPTQLHQPPSGPRGPPGGMYQGMPPYY